MRILVVEDDAPLADVLVRCLREEGYAVDHAEDGQEGEWLAFENPYDLIVLDIMLPRKTGLELLATLRQSQVVTPILMLTARDSTQDRVKGLDQGADDYLTKPFSLDELLARVRALFRRRTDSILPPVFTVGPIQINQARREVKIGDSLIDFTTKEFALLDYFARNSGTVLSRTQLSEHVWDANFEPSSNVVDVYVGYLRSKISKACGQPLIKTVRGQGYMLDTNDLSHAASEQHADL